MEYEVVYEYGLPHWVLVTSTMSAVGWVLATVAFTNVGPIELAARRTRVFLVIFGLGWGVLGGVGAYAQWTQHARVVDAERTVVQGLVRLLRTQPEGGHAPGDLVEVDGRRFEVDYFKAGPGYTRTLTHGGVLRPGADVRLEVADGRILKIALARGR